MSTEDISATFKFSVFNAFLCNPCAVNIYLYFQTPNFMIVQISEHIEKKLKKFEILRNLVHASKFHKFHILFFILAHRLE